MNNDMWEGAKNLSSKELEALNAIPQSATEKKARFSVVKKENPEETLLEVVEATLENLTSNSGSNAGRILAYDGKNILWKNEAPTAEEIVDYIKSKENTDPTALPNPKAIEKVIIELIKIKRENNEQEKRNKIMDIPELRKMISGSKDDSEEPPPIPSLKEISHQTPKMSFEEMIDAAQKTTPATTPANLSGQTLEMESLKKPGYSSLDEEFFASAQTHVARETKKDFEKEYDRQLAEGVKNAAKEPYAPWTTRLLDWPGKIKDSWLEKLAGKRQENNVKQIIINEQAVNPLDTNRDRLLKLLKRQKDIYDVEMDENGNMGFFARRRYKKLLDNENAPSYAAFKELTDKIVFLQSAVTNANDPEHKVIQPMMGPRKTEN